MSLQNKSPGKCYCHHAPVVYKKPVSSRFIGQHAFLGAGFVAQHRMMDKQWTMGHISNQFQAFTNLLNKCQQFNKMEKAYHHRNLRQRMRSLRTQCRNARMTVNHWHNYGSTEVRQIMSKHKNLQRLYQNLSLTQVLDSANDRTFRLRKERDRLRERKDRLSHSCLEIKKKLLEIQLRLKTIDESMIELNSTKAKLEKDIVNSKTRCEAFAVINTTYKTIKKTLEQDAIFYEPILQSLEQDIKDQSAFIQHILFLGAPAIHKFKQISAEYNAKEQKFKGAMDSLKLMTSVHTLPLSKPSLESNRRSEVHNCSNIPSQRWSNNSSILRLNASQYYVRETCSMLQLKAQLISVNAVIKRIKRATFRSYALELYPRIKGYEEENATLCKQIETVQLQSQVLEDKQKRAGVLKQVLESNLFEENRIRMHKIAELQEAIEREDQKQAECLESIKSRSEAYAIVRWTLWNLSDILRHVIVPETTKKVYPTKELTLPLLTFDMIDSRALPPTDFEENVKTLMQTTITRTRIITREFNKLNQSQSKISAENWRNFEMLLQQPFDKENPMSSTLPLDKEDDEHTNKISRNIPSRHFIKSQSMNIVERAHHIE